MGDKRKAVMAALMLSILIGQVTALTLIDYLTPVVLGPIGIIGYWLGLQKSEDYQQLISDYQAKLTSSTIQNAVNTRLDLKEIYARDQNIYGFGQDISEYTKNYAWSLAKYTLLKALSNGSTLTEAKALAKQAVEEYYQNVTASIIANQNETNNLLWHVIQNYANTSGLDTFTLKAYFKSHFSNKYGTVSYSFNPSTAAWSGSWVQFQGGTQVDEFIAQGYRENTKTISAVNRTYSITVIELKVYHHYYNGLSHQYDYDYEEMTSATLAGNEIYNTIECDILHRLKPVAS